MKIIMNTFFKKGIGSKSELTQSCHSCHAKHSSPSWSRLCWYTYILIKINYNSLIITKFSTVYCLNDHATVKHADVTMKIFESVGICHQVPEKLLDAFTGLSGSGPAYV